tara:strand:- start:550 stop:810 length:261 start_codon:yes stop_codon:yes gene_type:complete
MELKQPTMEHTDTVKILGDGSRFTGYFMIRCYNPTGERVNPEHPAMGMALPAVRVDIDQATYPTDNELLTAMKAELVSMGHTIEGE